MSIYLKIPDIPGNSTDANHKEWIDLSSFSWGAMNSRQMGQGSQHSRGKSSTQQLMAEKQIDQASKMLLFKCQAGGNLGTVELEVTKQFDDETQKAYYKLKLEDASIGNYNVSAGGGDNQTAYETFSIAFSKCTYDFIPENADYTAGAGSPKGWNVEENSEHSG